MKIKHLRDSLWVEFGLLAKQFNTANLAQGAPDFTVPIVASKKYASTICEQGPIQVKQLQEYLAKLYTMPVKNEKFSWTPFKMEQQITSNNVLITNGASQALFISIMSLVQEGDAVLILEPFFDLYRDHTLMRRAKPIYVNAMQADWQEQVQQAVQKHKPKLFIVNTPHNPTGHVLSQQELQFVARMCVEHDMIAISDEVYDFMVFAPNKHEKLANMPNMFDRTVTIHSLGKTLCATGWRVGYMIAPEHLLHRMSKLHSLCGGAALPLQHVALHTLQHHIESNYLFDEFPNMLHAKCQHLCETLEQCGNMFSRVIRPSGGFFILAERKNSNIENDIAYCRWLPEHVGVSAIPLSPFFDAQREQRFARFCFVKSTETLTLARERLVSYNNKL